MDREEKERREHIRTWAKFMIVHLERSEFDGFGYTYTETLERLKELIDGELDRVRGGEASPVEAAA